MKHALIASLTLMVAATTASAQGARNEVQATFAQPRVSNFALIPAVATGATMGWTTDNGSTSGGANVSVGKGSSIEAGALAELGRGLLVYQAGVLYMDYGTQLSASYTSPYNGSRQQNDGTGHISYVGLPLALKVRTRVAEGIRLAGRVGFTPAILVSSRGEWTSRTYNTLGQQISSNSSSDNGTEGLRSVNVFSVIGGGPEFRIARDQNVRLEAMYEGMMLPIQMNSSTTQTYLSAISAMLSYGIGF